jgi:hypothetical protein
MMVTEIEVEIFYLDRFLALADEKVSSRWKSYYFVLRSCE